MEVIKIYTGYVPRVLKRVYQRSKVFRVVRDVMSTDVVDRSILAKDRPLKEQVGEVCSSPLIAISLGTTIHEAACFMTSRHIKRLPIAENGKLVGIITARDLVEAYAK